MNIRDRILQRLRRPDYIPEPVPELVEQLGLARRDRRRVGRELEMLAAEGLVVRVKKDRYCVPRDADLVTGRINFRQSGAAVLIPDAKPGQPVAKPIEIAAEDTGVAMHSDHVVVRLADARTRKQNRRFSDRASGRVIRILERARETITGNLQQTRLFHYVVPDDPRIVNDIYVSNPERSPLTPRPRIGDKVVVRLHEWKQRHVNPEGEVIEVLGKTHEPRAELRAILHKYRLEPDFPEAVNREVANVPDQVRPGDRRKRLDLRAIPTITIDPDDAKDFDDALSLEDLPHGAVRIGVHIADVSSYVRPGSALDREAQKRGNSTYLVGTVIPMLPHALSNGICSLVEGVDRLTKSVLFTFDRRGRLQQTEFANSVIRSIKRLTYKQAYGLLNEDNPRRIRELPSPPAHQTGSLGRPLASLSDEEIVHLREIVRRFWSVAARLREDRMKHGSLDLDMAETKIYVDENGYADRLEKVVNDESHQLIEEFMLAANEAVAHALRQVNMPALYRVHDKPDEDRLQELREFLATFGVECGDLTNRRELVALLKQLRTHPQSHLLRTQVLRSLKKACYRGTPDGHFGLNKRDYLHFTSPIRRYPDLVVHRVFVHYIAKHHNQPLLPGAKIDYTAAKIASLGEHLSLTEVNSTDAERESVKVKLLEFFERELDKKTRSHFAAIITETRNHGMFIELTESMAFGLVHISTLDDLYYLTDDGTALVGRRSKKRYAVGDKIEVVVARVDRFKRQVDFKIVAHDPTGSTAQHSRSTVAEPAKKTDRASPRGGGPRSGDDRRSKGGRRSSSRRRRRR